MIAPSFQGHTEEPLCPRSDLALRVGQKALATRVATMVRSRSKDAEEKGRDVRLDYGLGVSEG